MRYAIVNHANGQLWGCEEADAPLKACEQLQAKVGTPSPEELDDVGTHTLDGSDEGFHVYEIPADFDTAILDQYEPGSRKLHDEVMADWPKAATIRITRPENNLSI